MKRLAVLLALFVLAVTLIAGSTALLMAARDKVEVREEVLAGSAEAAKGLSVAFRSMHGGRRLTWDTRFTLGGALAPESTFTFEATGGDRSGTRVKMDIFRYSMNVHGNGTDLMESFYEKDVGPYIWKSPVNMAMVGDVAARTANGTARTETLRLRDYTQTFEWQLILETEGGELTASRETRTALSELFKTPVPEDFYILCTVCRDARGRVLEISLDHTAAFHETTVKSYSPENGESAFLTYAVADSFSTLMIPAAMGDGGIWVYPSMKDSQGGEMIHCADGQGVYFIPLRSDGRDAVPDIANARCVYSTTADPVELGVGGGNVFLVTREGENYVLTVLDSGSGEVRSRVTLFEDAGEGAYTVERENLRLYVLRDGRFALIVCEDGEASVALTGRFDFDVIYTASDHPHTVAALIDDTTDLAWDGERLALAEGGTYREVIVLDQSGVLYHAFFDYSPLWDGRPQDWRFGAGSADYGYQIPMQVSFE